MTEGTQKTWKIEQIIINSIVFIFIPLIIGVLFYIFLPFGAETPLVRGGLAGALSVSIAGLLFTIRGLAKEGAFLINGGLIAFLVQFFISLSQSVGDPMISWLFGFLIVFLASIIYLVNIYWLGGREKITRDLFLKLSKGGSIVFLIDSLIMIVYSSYLWWFGNIYLSLGLGLMIIGAAILIFRNLISSKKVLYILVMLLLNVGLSLLIYWGVYITILNIYIALFLTCMIGFSITLFINIITYASTAIIPNMVWYKIFCLEFLCISIFGGCFFGFLALDALLKISIIFLWITVTSFATIYFAQLSEYFSVETYQKLMLGGQLAIGLEVPIFITLAIYNVTGPLIAVGIFGILLSLFNFRLKYKVVYYLNSINLSWGVGLVTAISIYQQYPDICIALFWAILVINGLLIGVFRFGLFREYLVQKVFYRINFINWVSLSVIIGFLIGWGTHYPWLIFFGILIGSFISSFSLFWAESGEMISKEQFYRLFRLIGIITNLQLVNVIILPFFRQPAYWIGYLATFFIILSIFNYFSLIKVREKRLILLNHGVLSFGVFLIISWINAFTLFYFVLASWVSLTIFIMIIPISFGINLASQKALYRFTFVINLLYTILTTWIFYYLVSILTSEWIYLVILLASLLLLPAFYFGRKGETFSERISYGLSCASFSSFVVALSIFLGTLLWRDIFYQITFVSLFVFILLIPDLYLLYRAQFVSESVYRKAVEVDEHILCGIFALILAGIPIVVSNNWAMGLGIFLTILGFLSGLIHLYYKRYNLFGVHLIILLSGFFWFLYNVLILVLITPITTVFWALFIDFILILFILDIGKHRGVIPVQKAHLGIILSSLSLSFITCFLVGWCLQTFLLLAIISSVFIFLLLSRVVYIYIDSNKVLAESICKLLLGFSKWACIVATSLFFYILLNTLNPLPFTLGYQIFNVSLASSLFIGFSCAFSKAFRDAFVKIITNRIFLTIVTALLGVGTAVLISVYANNLFLGLNIAVLIILFCWKAIFSQKLWGNYFIIGVPIVIGVLFYKLIYDFTVNVLNPVYFDNLYAISYSMAISTLIFFLFSYTFWKFKSNLKFGFLLTATLLFMLPIIYNFYYQFHPLSMTFTEFILGILPWLISIVLISNVGLSYYFKKQSPIFYLILLGGLFLFFTLIAFNCLYVTLDLSIRLISSLFAAGGLSFFIFSVFARYFKVLTEKYTAIALGISVISGSIAVGNLLYLYQGVDILISIGLAIDFGVFFYYLSLVCYFWEFSKRIWEKGWFIWIAIPVVNAFIIFLSFLPLGTEFIIFGIFLAIAVGNMLFLPIVFYRWRANFRLSWFIIWAEFIPLSFSTAYYFWFKDILGSALFTIGLITILLATLIYIIRIWKVSAILWTGLSIGNGVLFFITGLGVVEPIALVGISLVIGGLQAAALTIFPNIPKKYGTYIWMPVSGGITTLAVYFAQAGHFDIILTVLFAGLIFLLSLYPLILFGVDKKKVYRIIGYGFCPLVPLFTYFLLYNTLAITIMDNFSRGWLSASISLILTGFILLSMHKFDVLKREYWGISWAILSASITALFGWFGFYIFHILDNAVTLSLCFLIFEIILIPALVKFWKLLGEAIIITISFLLGILVSILFGLALGLLFSAIFLQFQKLLKDTLQKIQELLVAAGIFFFLFWVFQIFIEVFIAFLIAFYIVIFYPFFLSIIKKQWLIATLFWIGLIVVPVAAGVWFALDIYSEVDLFNSILLVLCTIFSLGLVLPAFRKISKKYIAILWMALGGTLSIYLYGPFVSVVLAPFPTVMILIMFSTLFFITLPWFGISSQLYGIGGTVLSLEATLLAFNYIYIGTSEDLSLTSLYALLIEAGILICFTLTWKKWTISMLVWYSISILLGILYGYHTFLIFGGLTGTGYMIGVLIAGSLIGLALFSSKLSINERFFSYLIFVITLTASISYFSSLIIFVGESSSLYITSFICFLFSSLLLLFYQGARSLIQEQSFLGRVYKASFWGFLSIFNVSTVILLFWCFFFVFSFSFELSFIISITLCYSFFLISKTLRTKLGRYLPYFYMILPIFLGGTVYSGVYFVAASLDFLLILYISLLVVFIVYWGLKASEAITWRIHEYLWALSPIPLVIYVGNLINLYYLDLTLAISSGFLIYAGLLLPLFITFTNERYLDYLWLILTISLTVTLQLGMMQLAKMSVYLPEDVASSLCLALTIGLGVAICRAFWQKSYKLVKILYLSLTIIASLTIYFALVNILKLTIMDGLLLSLLIWGNSIGIFAVFPEMNWHLYSAIWICISACFSFVGGYFIGTIASAAPSALLPALMVGLIILSLLWIKPPLAPPTFNIRKFLYPIIVIATNISLGWVIIVPWGLDVVIGILIPLLIGIQFLLILSLKNIIEKRYWKQIYLLTPIIAGILSVFIFYSYNLIDPYLNAIIPILIGLVLTFPLVVNYNPFRFLTFNCKLLFVGIAGVMWLFTFLIFGYVPFIVEQSFLKGLIATVVFILVIYSILPKAYEFTEFTYLYLSIGLSAGLSIIIFLFIGEAALWQKIILILILSAGAVCLGTYKIMAKKAETKPELSIWRLVLLIGGFIAIIAFTILLFAFLVTI